MGRADQREILILFSPYEYLLTVYTYKYLVLDYNKQLNCTCCVNLFWAEGYNSITQHNRLLVNYSKGESERDMPIAEREFKDSQEVELMTEVPLQDRELNPRE